MRSVDAEPIEHRLQQLQRHHKQSVDHFHQLEQWRDQLIAGDAGVMQQVLEKYPQTDRQQLNQLIRNARSKQEKLARKSSRALFRFLQELEES